jgi:hypothetical protein
LEAHDGVPGIQRLQRGVFQQALRDAGLHRIDIL